MARTPSTAASPPRNSTPPAIESGTLVRLRAAAAAVGVDEEELKRRAAAAGVKLHTVVRAGEAQPALDLDDVWRLRSDSAAPEPVDGHPSGIEVSRIASRLEKEVEEYRARHAQEVERSRGLETELRGGEQALRVEKSRQAQLEAQLSEHARTLAEAQRGQAELRASGTARERELKDALEAERKTSAASARTIESLELQTESALAAQLGLKQELSASKQENSKLAKQCAEIEALRSKIVELDSAIVQLNTALAREKTELAAHAGLKQELSASKVENSRLLKQTAELEGLRTKIVGLDGDMVQLNTALAREKSEAKLARELAAAKEAESIRLERDCQRLAPLEKKLAEEREVAKKAAALAQAKHDAAIAQHTEAQAVQRGSLEQKLKESLATAQKSDAARAIFERELGGARAELEKLEESCARATLERDRLKQRAESLGGQLATAIEGERALQRYADRKEAELAALRAEQRRT